MTPPPTHTHSSVKYACVGPLGKSHLVITMYCMYLCIYQLIMLQLIPSQFEAPELKELKNKTLSYEQKIS